MGVKPEQNEETSNEVDKFWNDDYFETLVQLFLYDFQLVEQLLVDKTNVTYHKEISED